MAAQLRARNGRLGAGAVLVDRPGDELLARATLSGDQHGKSLIGDTADGLVSFLHSRAGTDDGIARDLFVRRRLRDDGRLAHQPGDLERLADHAAQLLQIDRLEQVVVGPVPHRLDGRVSRPDHGDKDDRDAGVDSAELRQDVEAGLVGQAEVQENNVRARSRDSFQALGAGVGDGNPVSGRGEHVAHLVAKQVRFVIDQEQVSHGFFTPFAVKCSGTRGLL